MIRCGGIFAGQTKSDAPPKRKLEPQDDKLVDSQKMALMTRKQRKMYHGLRQKEEEKAARIADLHRKRSGAELSDS
jgi:hypothetical protein